MSKSNSYNIVARWEKQSSVWYRTLILEITNNTEENILHGKVGFDASAIYYSEINFIEAVNGISDKNGVITITLFRQLNANSKVIAKLGFNFPHGIVNPPLPTKFTVNGYPANDDTIPPIEDHTPPSIVTGIELVKSGPTSLSLKWKESKDESGIKEYIVFYAPKGQGVEDFKATTTNSILLNALKPNTKYEVSIQAVDNAENKSVISKEVEFSTGGNSPDNPVLWEINAAPYVDATAFPTPDLTNYSNKTGVKNYFLGFITAGKDVNGKVIPAWGGFNSIYDSNEKIEHTADTQLSNYLKKGIENLKGQKGNIILSFGGAANLPIEAKKYLKTGEKIASLEVKVDDIDTIVAMYNSTITNYQAGYIDFDFEGGFLANAAALDRHIKAIKQVTSTNPNLKISYTLPVDGAPGLMGFNSNGEKFLKLLADNGIRPHLINIMAMEFGQGSSDNLFECTKLSIEGKNDGQPYHQGAIRQIKNVWHDLDDVAAYKMLGVCPMIGKNNNGKIFKIADQKSLKQYAAEKDITLLSFWSANNDLKGSAASGTPQELGEFSTIISSYDPNLLGLINPSSDGIIDI